MDISSMISSITDSLGGNNLISIGGAIVVVIVAVFIFRSGPKTEKTKDNDQTPAKKAAAQPSAAVAPPEDQKEKNGFASKWKEKLSILKSIRSRSKHNDAASEEAVLVPDILMDEAETVQETEPEDDSMVFSESEPIVEVTDEATGYDDPGEDSPVLEINDDVFGEESAEIAAEEQSEAETIVEEEPVQEIAYSEPQVEKSNDDIFSMFSEESLEENEISKFAATLDHVDINDLINEIQDMRKYMRK